MRTKRLTAPSVTTRGGGVPSIVISTEGLDSEHDVIRQAGLTFRERVPLLFGHDYHELPVGQVTEITRQPGRTVAAWRWLDGDERAARVRNAFEQGVLSASVGLLVEQAAPNAHGGYDIQRATCVEVSLVPVPANAECARRLRQLGLQWKENANMDRFNDPFITYVVNENDLAAAMVAALPGIIAREVAAALDQQAVRLTRRAVMALTGRVD